MVSMTTSHQAVAAILSTALNAAYQIQVCADR
jgi:hypothetical protein